MRGHPSDPARGLVPGAPIYILLIVERRRTKIPAPASSKPSASIVVGKLVSAAPVRGMPGVGMVEAPGVWLGVRNPRPPRAPRSKGIAFAGAVIVIAVSKSWKLKVRSNIKLTGGIGVAAVVALGVAERVAFIVSRI